MNKGETWYIQFGKGSGISEREIVDITEKTVLLRDNTRCHITRDERRVTGELIFVEKIK